MHTSGVKTPSKSGYVVLLLIQVVFLILFASLTGYDEGLLPKNGTLQFEENQVYVPKYPRKIFQSIFLFFVILLIFACREQISKIFT